MISMQGPSPQKSPVKLKKPPTKQDISNALSECLGM
jgi:hypothetical protein